MSYFPASPEITVIVAVYNAEPWIRRCLDALRVQTFDNFEVIMVDDGSTDHSGKICDEYVAQDSRFHVIHKENGGVSSARQCGLEHAQGRYVIHADPDDWTEPTLLEHLFRKAEETNADMVICDIWRVTPKTRCYWQQSPPSLDPREVFQALFQQLHGSCCNKLVKRACYSKYGIGFVEGITYREDTLINARLLQEKISIAYLPEALVNYCIGFHDSLTNFSSESNYEKLRILRSNLITYIKYDFHKLCLPFIEAELASLALNLGKDEINNFSASFPFLKVNQKACNLPILRIYFFLCFHGCARAVCLWIRVYHKLLKR